MDFDPRDSDSRDEHRFALTRDRNDNGPTLGRAGSNSRESHDEDGGRENGRAPERDRDERLRDNDARDVFTRQLSVSSPRIQGVEQADDGSARSQPPFDYGHVALTPSRQETDALPPASQSAEAQ